MRIAIIEDDLNYQKSIHKVLSSTRWEYTCFNSSLDFGKAVLKEFDVIISDYHLPRISGRELLKSISDKTSAELFLMVENGDFEGKRELYLKHSYDGLPLEIDYLRQTMENIYYMWNRPVHLETVRKELNKDKRKLLTFNGTPHEEITLE